MKSTSNYNQLDDKDINLTKAKKKKSIWVYCKFGDLEAHLKHSTDSLKIYNFSTLWWGVGVGKQGHQDDM